MTQAVDHRADTAALIEHDIEIDRSLLEILSADDLRDYEIVLKTAAVTLALRKGIPITPDLIAIYFRCPNSDSRLEYDEDSCRYTCPDCDFVVD